MKPIFDEDLTPEQRTPLYEAWTGYRNRFATARDIHDFRTGFDAGWNARDERTCEWVKSPHWDGHLWTWKWTSCLLFEHSYTNISNFCPYCGGKIVRAAAK